MNIAVWYHIALTPPIDRQAGLTLFREQMSLLKTSGLAASSAHTVIGVNGTNQDVKDLNGFAHGSIILHENCRSELPTLYALQKWLPGHEDWYVCYWHAKGVTHPGNEAYFRWRKCMELAVIVNHKRCLNDLDRGYQTVGCHWIDRTKYPHENDPPTPGWNFGGHIWGGNFFWAKASYLLTLPPLPQNSTCRAEDFLAEIWPGSGFSQPIAFDYAPHWPTSPECRANARCFFIKQ